MTPSHRTIDGKTGNVGGRYWAFENHFWINFAGRDYDVLFGEMGAVNTSTWVKYKGEEGEYTLFGEPPLQYKIFETGKGKIEDRYEFVSGPK